MGWQELWLLPGVRHPGGCQEVRAQVPPHPPRPAGGCHQVSQAAQGGQEPRPQGPWSGPPHCPPQGQQGQQVNHISLSLAWVGILLLNCWRIILLLLFFSNCDKWLWEVGGWSLISGWERFMRCCD